MREEPVVYINGRPFVLREEVGLLKADLGPLSMHCHLPQLLQSAARLAGTAGLHMMTPHAA
jgi:hypothetical protein